MMAPMTPGDSSGNRCAHSARRVKEVRIDKSLNPLGPNGREGGASGGGGGGLGPPTARHWGRGERMAPTNARKRGGKYRGEVRSWRGRPDRAGRRCTGLRKHGRVDRATAP